jgi:CHAD domain-containing protein
MLAGIPARRWPSGLATLPVSQVRDRIAPVVGVRALLPLAEVEVRSLAVRVLDDEDKTRVRVQVDQQRLAGAGRAPLPLRVLISPLRGYERDGHRCLDLLGETLSPLPANGGAAVAALTAAGHVPGQAAVPALHLDPLAPAPASLAAVLHRWIDVVAAVRPGVLAEVDIEYLHEMRTSVRAARSLLRLAGELLPEVLAAQLAADLAWLGALTGPLRDLDVALLELNGRGDSEARGLDGLDPMREVLAKQRRRALARVRGGLRSARGTALTGQWQAALETLSTDPPPGAPPIGEVAAAQAYAAYRRIVKAAAPVTADSPADDLHRLRRRCKQMRYVLDGYASVYPTGPQREVLAALKSLQDCLGTIQDVDVQCRQLTDLAEDMIRAGTPAETLLAMGALRERTLGRDATARQNLLPRLRRFCGPATQARVRELGGAR